MTIVFKDAIRITFCFFLISGIPRRNKYGSVLLELLVRIKSAEYTGLYSLLMLFSHRNFGQFSGDLVWIFSRFHMYHTEGNSRFQTCLHYWKYFLGLGKRDGSIKLAGGSTHDIQCIFYGGIQHHLDFVLGSWQVKDGSMSNPTVLDICALCAPL